MTNGRSTPSAHLAREMTLLGLIATALCAMIGVGINIIPFMLQRSRPGIGDAVPWAFVVAAVPAALAALCYAMLSSAMPRAGGSYVYATRALNPFAGFLASFAQWFGLSMGMGVVAYLMVPMLRDTLLTAGWAGAGAFFEQASVRVPLALGAIWAFWWVNRVGIRAYERTVVIMAVAMIAGPVVMTITGFLHTPADFARAMDGLGTAMPVEPAELPAFSRGVFLSAAVVLFSSFIGFDAISQAGGEARNPSRALPRSILLAMGVVTLYYLLFTSAVYHAVPWDYIYRVSLVRDVSAPALLAPLMPPWLGVVILLAVTVAILNSIPSVMLANSRMLYAFGTDRIFPAALGRVHPVHRTPHVAITVTAIAGSLSVVGCHFAGDFFLGVDVLVLSMLLNFVLMAVAVVTFPKVNPHLYRDVAFLRSRATQVGVAVAAGVLLATLLVIQLAGDLTSATPWYLRSTTIWIAVMAGASLVFVRSWRRLRDEGVDPRRDIFNALPEE
jgi:basic amino acid/polyamine antiporter, APA family